MPRAGERSAHDCPECGLPMYWSEAAVRDPDLLARSAPGDAAPFPDAYLCENGHTSLECPVCGSFDTAAWTDNERPSHYHVVCAVCGNDAIAER